MHQTNSDYFHRTNGRIYSNRSIWFITT